MILGIHRNTVSQQWCLYSLSLQMSDKTNCHDLDYTILSFWNNLYDWLHWRFNPCCNYLLQDVCRQIYATLYDYPCLKDCIGLQNYISDCVRVAWGLSVQNPPYLIQYDSRKFNTDIHTRFHVSNQTSDEIQTFIWPGLTEGFGGHCVCKAVVITWYLY